jgi:uncharacterized protein involved in exopolysaccharide biosynthesis
MTPAQHNPPRRSPATDPEGIPLLWIARSVGRRRRLVLVLALGTSLLVVLYSAFQSRSYTSYTTFMPHGNEGKLGQLSGLAAQFGLTVPKDDPGASPGFYAYLLQTRELLRSTVRTTYDVPVNGGEERMTLTRWYDPPGDTPAEQEEAAIKRLRNELRASTDGDIGTVELKVRSGSPRLAYEITQRLMALVSEFNLQKRQSQAAAERKFVQTQVADARDRLGQAEGRLQAFLQRNREYRSSPQLAFEYDRLARDVSMQQDVYTTLAKSLEQARIEEVRNTPVLTVVDPPTLPALPDRRWILAKGLLGILLGAMVGVLLALGRDLLEGQAPAREALPELDRDEVELAMASRGSM